MIGLIVGLCIGGVVLICACCAGAFFFLCAPVHSRILFTCRVVNVCTRIGYSNLAPGPISPSYVTNLKKVTTQRLHLGFE